MSDQQGIDLERQALLPAGLRDGLPPDAEFEASVAERLVACLRQHGYRRIRPPIVEFETSLLSGTGAAMGERTFRVMDPLSQRMMGVRADMTVQAARIAGTRLKNEPRPMRLCYAGDVLRVKADQLVPERQLLQIGAELIGHDSPQADAEVILLAVDALGAVGVDGLSVDITVPALVPMVLEEKTGSADVNSRLRQAIDRKDVAAMLEEAGDAASALREMMDAAGDADDGLAALNRLDLSPEARTLVARLAEVSGLIRNARPDLPITIDPVENRGYEYHTGIGFSLFRKGVRGELGRGGSYMVEGAASEPATGFSLYLETLIRALPEPRAIERVFVSVADAGGTAGSLREDGWSVVCALEDHQDIAGEARRMGCSHYYSEGQVIALDGR